MFDEELSKNAVYILSSTSMPISLTDVSVTSALVKENCVELKFNLEHDLLNNNYKEFSRKPLPIEDKDKDTIGGGKFIAAIEKRDVPQVIIVSSSSNSDHNNAVRAINDTSAPLAAVLVEKEINLDSKSTVISADGRNELKTSYYQSATIPTNNEAEINERKVFNMIEVTKAKREDAIFYLGMYDGDLDRAITEYFNSDNH